MYTVQMDRQTHILSSSNAYIERAIIPSVDDYCACASMMGRRAGDFTVRSGTGQSFSSGGWRAKETSGTMDSFPCHTQEWRWFRSDWFAYSGGGNTGKGKLLLIAWSNWSRIWPSLLEQKHLDTLSRWLYTMVKAQALMAIQSLAALTLFMKWNRRLISKQTLRRNVAGPQD